MLDNPLRENEADLIIAASALTPEKASFLIHHSSGYLCAPLPASLADSLDLAPMVSAKDNSDPNRTAYTITVDAAETGTGISATDRSLTCRRLADAAQGKCGKEGFRRPGHIVPLRAVPGGIRKRQGHTEAAVELCRLAGLPLVGVIGEVTAPGVDVPGKGERSGTGMMTRDESLEFGERYGIRVVTIEDLVEYVEEKEGKLS